MTAPKLVHGASTPQEGGYSAYVPAPLPPPVQFSSDTLRAVSAADWLLGRLAGEARTLPNPKTLWLPFVRREAVLSSRIEGTTTTIGELLAHEAGAVVERDPDDLQEVTNYIAALDLGMERLRSVPVSLALIRELHARLMRGVRGDRKSPGEFRSTQNWIGRPGSHIRDAIYVPPPPSAVASCLERWERFLADRSLPALVQLAMLHYQFEAIHPFRDGNGRVGRLLITLFLLERKLLPSPLLYLSAFFEATRQEYYRRLLAVSTEGDWEEWIIYFLNAVARQSEDAADRAARINALTAEWRRLVSASGSRSDLPIRLVDRLAGNPYATARGLARREQVAFTTAQRAIARLERLGILRQVNDTARDRLYCATGLLDILEEPARLVPEPD